MFKRFKVMDIFHDEYLKEVDEWVDVKNLPDEIKNIYKVKLSNNDQTTAYFCHDMCIGLISYYKAAASYWWNKQTGEPIYDVTHWGKPKKEIE